MDREKVNEAAITYAKKNTTALNPFGRIMDDFKSGADWLMQQPLSERLTDEEKEKIRAKYNELKSLNAITNDMFTDDTAILEWLFGSDLFNQPTAI